MDEVPVLNDPGDVFDDRTDPAAAVGKLPYDTNRTSPVSGGPMRTRKDK